MWSLVTVLLLPPLFLPLQARSYLNKLPAKFAEDDLILITDPMLATGGTMMQVRHTTDPWLTVRFQWLCLSLYAHAHNQLQACSIIAWLSAC